MQTEPLENTPGFRRRFRITPQPGRVCCEVEDDYHCMAVTVYHDDALATRVEPLMRRAPWTTCPGAVEELKATFTGLPLSGFARRGAKKANCTHLHDLAVLAAQHAFDDMHRVYDILVGDPVEGRRRAEFRSDGETVLNWTEAGFRLVAPADLAGMSLWEMQHWIKSLEPGMQEAARLLRWGNILASGRSTPLDRQSDASRMPANCYTFQPEQAAVAVRVGETVDFSSGQAQALADYQPFS